MSPDSPHVQWSLEGDGRSSARLRGLPAGATPLQVVCQAQQIAAWDLRLKCQPDLSTGTYRLTLRARAQRPTVVSLVATCVSDPRQSLGEICLWPLDDSWRQWIYEFRSPGPQELQLLWALGGAEGLVELADWHWQRWDRGPLGLVVGPDAVAQLVPCPDAPGGVRVARARTGPDRWDICLRWNEQLSAGAHRLCFRARAEHPLTVEVLARAATSAGPTQLLHCDGQWREFFYEFTSPEDGQTQLEWALGGEQGAVDLDDFACQPLDRDPMVLQASREALAQLTACPGEAAGLRVLRQAAALDRWDVCLKHVRQLSPGPHRLTFRVRSEGPTLISVIANPADEQQLPAVNHSQLAFCDGQWRDVIYEFNVPTAEHMLFAWAVGAADGAIDLADLQWQPLNREPLSLHAVAEAAARLSTCPDKPDGLRIARQSLLLDRWDVCLKQEARLAAGSYRLLFRARSDRPSTIGVLANLTQDTEEILVPACDFQLDELWRDFLYEFECPVAESWQLLWPLGAGSGTVDLADLRWQTLPRPPLMLTTQAGSTAQLVPCPEAPGGLRVVRDAQSADRWDICLKQIAKLPAGPGRLTFRARADRPSLLEVLAAPADSPTTHRTAPSQVVHCDGQWRQFSYEFNAPPAGATQVAWALGAAGGAFDLTDVDWQPLARPPVHLVNPLGTVARLETCTDREGAVRVQRQAAGQDRWDLCVKQQIQLPVGSYRLRFQARADRPTRLGVLVDSVASLAQIPPNLSQIVDCGTQWQEFIHEFDCPTADAMEIAWAVGADSGQVDLADWRCEPLQRSPLQLLAAPDVVAHLVPLAHDDMGVRIQREASHLDRWDVCLKYHWLASAGSHQLLFRARADRATMLEVLANLAGDHPSAAGNTSQFVHCDRQWHEYLYEFSCPRTGLAQIAWALGADQGGVELADFRCQPLAQSPRVLHAVPEGLTRLIPCEDLTQGIRIHREAEDLDRWDVCLKQVTLLAAGAYRLTFRARADRATTLAAMATLVDDPECVLLPSLEWQIDDPWRELLYETESPMAGASQWVWALGGGTGAVDLDGPRYQALARDPWRLRCAAEAHAWLETGKDDPSRDLRVVVDLAQDNPLDVLLLSKPRTVQQGVSYRLSFAARSQRSRWLTTGVRQVASPWENLGLRRRAQLATQWQHFQWVFAASEDEPSAQAYISLGHEPIWVELRDLIWEAVAGPADSRAPLELADRAESAESRPGRAD